MTYSAQPDHKSLSVQPAEKTRFETGIPWITSRVPALTVWVYSCGEPSVGKTFKHNILAMSMNFKCVPSPLPPSVCALSLLPTQRKQMYLVAGRSVSQTNYRITCPGTTWWQSAHKSPYFFTSVFLKKKGGGFQDSATAGRLAFHQACSNCQRIAPYRLCQNFCPSRMHECVWGDF